MNLINFLTVQTKIVNGLQMIVPDTHAIMNGIRRITVKSKTHWKKFLEPETVHSLDTFERISKTNARLRHFCIPQWIPETPGECLSELNI